MDFRLIAAVFFICGLLLLPASWPQHAKAGGAAKCAVAPIGQAKAGASAIFAGKVLKISEDGRAKVFEFAVEKYWKGNLKKRVKIRVNENARYQAWMKAGERYLVFAEANDRGELFDRRCSRTKSLGAAGEDLAFLGKAKKPR